MKGRYLSVVLALASTTALAQPAERDHRRHDDHDRDHRGPTAQAGVTVGPTEAPPPPQVENPGTKAGFEWVAGHWDWKAGKWAWLPGHWERPRAGKHWHPGRWEQREGKWAYAEGEWGEGVAPVVPPVVVAPAPVPPVPPTEGTPVVRDHRDHEWKIDRPIVSSYWPPRGKVGTKVVIHGRNFPPDATVMWGSTQITAAKIDPERIMFEVPAGATSGEIVLHRGHGRDLPVGTFEIVTTGDPEADLRRADEERRKAAEAAWATRQKELAKDRAAREAAWQKREEEREATRDHRREEREKEIRAKWETAFLADPDTQAELTLHAQRLAELDRAKEIAEVKADGKLAVRVDVALGKENARHDQRMAALQTSFKTKGGAP